MRLGDLFKNIFGPSAAIPANEPALTSTNENALAPEIMQAPTANAGEFVEQAL